MKAIRSAPLLAVALAVAGCAPTETAEQAAARMRAESDSVRAMAETVAANFSRWFGARQTDSIASLYAADAQVMPPGMPTLNGVEAVRAAFADPMMAGQLTFRVENVTANGPLAVERGRWTWIPPQGSPIPPDSGRYLVHWHRQADGAWKMV